MGLREVYSSKEVLECAIIDGINLYLRNVLQPYGIIKDEDLSKSEDAYLTDMKYKIAKEVAHSWEH